MLIEKSSLIHENGEEQSFKEAGSEESILEYGPGIVKRLRSRYQSLALRHTTLRPSLRRATSLENCLDTIGAEEEETRIRLLRQSSSPSPPTPDIDKTSTGTSLYKKQPRTERTTSRSRLPSHGVERDRMRRARSVDTLQSRSREEQEYILEKFKTVVLPREEIVIIEVSQSQPQKHISDNYFHSRSAALEKLSLPLGGKPSGNRSEKQQRFLASNNHHIRVIASPEYELPPMDIVRETARIFEKNQDNLLDGKQVGHALRVNRNNNTELPSPNSPMASPVSKKFPAHQVPTAAVSPNSVLPKESSEVPLSTQPFGNSQQPIKVAGSKQVGVIRPTVNISKANNYRVQNSPSSPNAISVGNKKNGINLAQKPPLSPKPLFTSERSQSLNSIGKRPKVSNHKSESSVLSPINGPHADVVDASTMRREGSPTMVNDIVQRFKHKAEASTERPKSPERVNRFAIAEEKQSKENTKNEKHIDQPLKEVKKHPVATADRLENRPVEYDFRNKVPNENGDSVLRSHQKQKPMNGSTMLFNFTDRKKVPDYIEDDGLHYQRRMKLGGTVNDESSDGVDNQEMIFEEYVSVHFEGGNVIINGKSSIQTKPKSKKVEIFIFLYSHRIIDD